MVMWIRVSVLMDVFVSRIELHSQLHCWPIDQQSSGNSSMNWAIDGHMPTTQLATQSITLY